LYVCLQYAQLPFSTSLPHPYHHANGSGEHQSSVLRHLSAPALADLHFTVESTALEIKVRAPASDSYLSPLTAPTEFYLD
jgi:hypothetical protein